MIVSRKRKPGNGYFHSFPPCRHPCLQTVEFRLISIFLTNEDSAWNNRDIAGAALKLDMAARFIADESQKYGKNIELIYDGGPRSYAKVYSCHDLDTYSEVCFVFDDSPSTCAHEILHLFGAEDLYNGLTYHEIGGEVVAYVRRTFPGDIMLDDRSIDRPDSIPFEISRLTAYNLGWLDDVPELELFPTLRHDFPAVLNIEW